MMKIFLISFSILLLGYSSLQAEESTTDTLSSFIAGKYHLLGKAPDSNETYYGTLTLTLTKEGIKIQRIIKGKTTFGRAKMEKSSADNIDILRIHFTENSIDYEETCLIGSDLDNYPRITCHLYRLDPPGRTTTDDPGLEALFIDHR